MLVSWVRTEFTNGAARTLDLEEREMHEEYKTPGGELVMAELDVREGRLKDVEVIGFSDESVARAVRRALA